MSGEGRMHWFYFAAIGCAFSKNVSGVIFRGSAKGVGNPGNQETWAVVAHCENGLSEAAK